MSIKKEIPGSYGRYYANTEGEIFGPMGKLKLHVSNKQYYKVTIYDLSKKKKYNHYVHRLIAETFLEKKDEHTQVNHIDGNRQNNRLENLEWCTAQENQQHARITGLVQQNGEKHVKAKLTNADAIAIREKKSNGHTLKQLSEEYGVSKCVVSYVVNRVTYKDC